MAAARADVCAYAPPGSNYGHPNKELSMSKIRETIVLLAVALAWAGAAIAGPVNVNTADAETISAELKGVGISKAIAIVEYRKANGPFQSVDDLARVKGIGERTVEINRANILVAARKSK